MRYLVTGGAGFIGSHITERLLKEGHTVRVLDNFSSGKEENLSFAGAYADNFKLIRGDIRDKAVCEQAGEKCDAIFHQAALRSVPKSMSAPHEYNAVNIDGTLNILEAARQAGVKRVVFASSSSVYGDVSTFPEREDFYPLLISPYALSKLAGEYYCRIFSEFFGVETVALRYFNVFGPRQALDDEYAVVIPKFITCILNDEQPPIFGTGKQSRDFTYIDNVVEANVLSATAPDIKHEVLNVANGSDTTVLELVQQLNAVIGKEVEPKFLPPRAGDVFRTLADVAKLKSALGFETRVDFTEGLRRTVEWFKKS
ncbi:MAG: SDR family oxidoreductase [Candidatus Omnitrophica bacterium]|nr:SDR family oxidoreductase [Candidatus Omnitrophota bacterium]